MKRYTAGLKMEAVPIAPFSLVNHGTVIHGQRLAREDDLGELVMFSDVQQLARECRPYLESFASLTKHPTASRDALALAARLRAIEGDRSDAPSLPDPFKAYASIGERIGKLAAGCVHKEVEQLTYREKLAMAIMAGCEWEHTETGIRVTDEFGIQKIDGRFIVAIKRK